MAGRRKTKKPISAKAKATPAAAASRKRKTGAPRSAKKKPVARAAKASHSAKKTSRRAVKKSVTKKPVAKKAVAKKKTDRKVATRPAGTQQKAARNVAKKAARSVAKKKTARAVAGKRVTKKPVAGRSAARKSVAARDSGRRATSRKPQDAAKSNRKPIVKAMSASRPVRAKAVAKKTQVPKPQRTKLKLRAAPVDGSVVPSPTPAKPKIIRFGSLAIELAPEGAAIPKTRIQPNSLKRYAEKLLAKRRELVGDVNHLTHEALSGKSGSVSGSHMPLHMADIGTDNWEQEFTLGLIDSERALLREIDEALDRIKKRTYGVCLATHRPIRRARLVAKPWAKYTIDYARLRELGKVP